MPQRSRTAAPPTARPALRPHDREGGYYAAFISDADGNRIEAVTFFCRRPVRAY
jgi:hypothetical protein